MTKLTLQPIEVSVSSIFLDPENPRLVGIKAADPKELCEDAYSLKNQELLRRILMQREGGSHLMESMIRLGFVSTDAIVVKKLEEDRYICIEGNRRLAALKTILNDIDRKVIKLSKEVENSLSPLGVRLLETKESLSLDVALIQGIRHISGVKSWGPYQQGHLIDNLVKLKGLNVTEAAKAIGLSISRASTLLKAYYGLKQALEHPHFASVADTTLFSHFEYAYVKQPVRDWLGWSDAQKQYTNGEAFNFFCLRITQSQDSMLCLSAREVRDCLPLILTNNTARKKFLDGGSVAETALMCNMGNEHFESTINSTLAQIEEICRHKKDVSHAQKLKLIRLNNYINEILSGIDL